MILLNSVPLVHELIWSYPPGSLSLDIVQGRVGVPKEYLSGFESFEAPDPAEWVPHGYAVVNVNARGIMGSGSDQR